MAANPLIVQGTLNRIIGSVTVPSFPNLNVTAPFLGRQAIRLALEGQSTVFLPTLTGAVTSGEPYLMVSVRIALLKTQGLAGQYKQQMETLSTIGDIIVRADTTALPTYYITNCAIESIGELSYAGDNTDFPVVIKGYYIVNNALFNLV